MTDRRKMRGFRRTMVTDKRERERITAENEQRFHEVKAEDAQANFATNKAHALTDQEIAAPYEKEENWTPPRSLAEHMKLVNDAFPDWPLEARIWQARRNMEIFPLMEQAVEDGLKMGNVLREQAHYGHGWTWPSLQKLRDFDPHNQTHAIDQVLAIVRKRVTN